MGGASSRTEVDAVTQGGGSPRASGSPAFPASGEGGPEGEGRGEEAGREGWGGEKGGGKSLEREDGWPVKFTCEPGS